MCVAAARSCAALWFAPSVRLPDTSDRSVSRSPPSLLVSASPSAFDTRIAPGSPPVPAAASSAQSADPAGIDNAALPVGWATASPPCARSPRRRLAPSAPTRAGGEALQLFSDELAQLAQTETRVALLPDVIGSFADPVLAADVADLRPAFRLPQCPQYLLLGVTPPRHPRRPPCSEDHTEPPFLNLSLS